VNLLVTGGAGYVGSHVVAALVRDGRRVLVVDDLSNGHAEALPGAVELERADVTASGILPQLAAKFGARAILHFAARIQVGESVARPDLYYATNVGGMLRVIEAASAGRLPVVFSSTAAVYGEPDVTPIPVEHPCRPQNPYGRSKWIGEQMLADAGRAARFGWAALRYFNAAGAEPGLFERHHPETHLIPLAIAAARGSGAALELYGDDWPTPDGTCVRDYVHVADLADAHLRALDLLLGGASAPAADSRAPAADERAPAHLVNLGAGRGVTVREVLAAVERAVGRPVPHRVAPRRPGDVAALVADVTRARDVLGWQPRRSSIDEIVVDAVRSS